MLSYVCFCTLFLCATLVLHFLRSVCLVLFVLNVYREIIYINCNGFRIYLFCVCLYHIHVTVLGRWGTRDDFAQCLFSDDFVLLAKPIAELGGLKYETDICSPPTIYHQCHTSSDCRSNVLYFLQSLH